MKIFLIIAAAAVIISAAECVYESFFLLTVRRERLSGSGSTIKTAHISDLHKRRFGEGNIRLTDRIREGSPDVIFITGDLVSRTETDFTAAEQLMRELCRIAPVYMIFGNHEQSLPPGYAERLENAAQRAGVTLLHNSHRVVDIRGRELYICGFDPDYSVYKTDEGGYSGLSVITAEDIAGAVGERPESGTVLLLAHNPLFAEEYARWGADMTFCGHVHGGVVRLFGVGLLSPERRLFPRYTKGVYDMGHIRPGSRVLVSAGLGKLRLFDPAEVVFYDI
ncbi:MAG: metallophosphoesterase [Ruminococcus sp.]|nr:metallophosphoesterase [Ruminococcus sp.]